MKNKIELLIFIYLILIPNYVYANVYSDADCVFEGVSFSLEAANQANYLAALEFKSDSDGNVEIITSEDYTFGKYFIVNYTTYYAYVGQPYVAWRSSGNATFGSMQQVRLPPDMCREQPPEECSDEEAQQAEEACKDKGGVEYVPQTGEIAECVWHCKDNDCSQEIDNANCPLGIKRVDSETCEVECIDCDDIYLSHYNYCKDKGGIYERSCDPESGKISVTCNGLEDGQEPGEAGEPPEDAEPGQTPSDPPDPNNPDNQPEEDPENNPDNTADENQREWLESIKHDSDTQINQNNDIMGQLNDVVANTATIADNQGILQDEIRHGADVTRAVGQNIQKSISALADSNKEEIDNLKELIEDNIEEMRGKNPDGGMATLADVVHAIDNSNNNGNGEIDLSALSTNETVPEVPEFNSDMPTDKNYTEYEDGTTLATDKASEYASENLETESIESPIHAEIVANGDPCLSKTIYLRGNAVNIDICFNEPWMLQGYALMRVVFIAIGYLQVAIMINEGLRA